jgi:hypothetical protein
MTSETSSASPARLLRLIRRILLSSPALLLAAGLLIYNFSDLPNALRWPARFLILFSAALGLWKFPFESRSFLLVCARMGTDLWSAIASAIEHRSRGLLRVERLLALVAIAVALVPFVLLIRDMSWSSLRTDEITSVDRYSSQGPWYVMSNYQRANNHILFNLLNSITPWAESMHPLRARFWSFVSMIALVASAGLTLWRRTPTGAALMIAAICLNTYHLHLEFQARANGMASLLAFVAAACFIRHSRTGGMASLAGLAAATVLGTYAVPYFVIFGGGLLLFLFLSRPDVPRFLAGFYAVSAIILLHLPVLGQILAVAEAYDEDYEAGFASASSAWSVVNYLIPGELPLNTLGHSAAFMTLLLLTALHPLIWRSRRARDGMIVAGVAVGFVAFCYLLESPPRRVAAFVVIPFAFGLIVAGSAALSLPPLRPFGRVAAPLACGALILFSVHRASIYEFEPTQRWREFGKALTLLYPNGVVVWIDTDLRNNRAYLNERFNLAEGGEIDTNRFKSGGLVLHDANYNPRTNKRVIEARELPDGAARVSFAAKGGETVLWFMGAGAGLVDGKQGEGSVRRFEVSFNTAPKAADSDGERGVILQFKSPPRRLSISYPDPGGTWHPLPRERFFLDGANLFLRMPSGVARIVAEAELPGEAGESATFLLPRMPSKTRN